MPTLSEIRLALEADSFRAPAVMLTYQIEFSPCEVLAATVYLERVTVFTCDRDGHENLVRLPASCLQAHQQTVRREVRAQMEIASLAGELRGFLAGDLVSPAGVYAEVELTPFVPCAVKAQSNLVVSSAVSDSVAQAS